MIDTKKIRSVLMTAVVAALAATPVAAHTPLGCSSSPTWNGLFCNNGDDIEFCDNGGGDCTVQCDGDPVPVMC